MFIVFLKITKINILESNTKTLINPNLLDNYYFVNPINQRNKSEYISTSTSYTIDRWRFFESNVVSVSVIPNVGLKQTGTGTWRGFAQLVDQYMESGTQLTFSVILKNNLTTTSTAFILLNGWALSDNLNSTNGSYDILTARSILLQPLQYKIYYSTVTLNQSIKQIKCLIGNINTPYDITWIGAKLEVGSKQTLGEVINDGGGYIVYDIPNPEVQLARCQRYLVPINNGVTASMHIISSGNSGTTFWPTPVTMRINPVLQNLTIKPVLIPNALDNANLIPSVRSNGIVIYFENATGLTASSINLARIETDGFFNAEL